MASAKKKKKREKEMDLKNVSRVNTEFNDPLDGQWEEVRKTKASRMTFRFLAWVTGLHLLMENIYTF